MNPEGNFTYPDRFGLNFFVGTEVAITWTTVYKRSNLYVAQYENDANSVPIATNIQNTSQLWVVKTASTNLTLPFHFRIVNSEGSDADQKRGGFWSYGFYILPDHPATTSSATSESLTTSQSSQTSGSLTASQSSQTSGSLPSSQSSQISTDVPPPASPITSGAIAGIVIAAVVFFSVLGALLFYLGKRSRQPVQPSKLPRTGEVGQGHAMDAYPVNPETGRGRVWGRHEATMLDGRQLPVELN